MKPIVILDSGAGGLTVFDEIQGMMPWLPVVYCADNGGFPYGPKPEEVVVDRVCRLLTTLTEHYQPSLAVIACNTASTVALSAARKLLQIPVVGVVPAIKTAATLTKNHCIGLLATPGTVNRPYTNDLILNFAQHCQVIRVGSTELVEIAEGVFRGEATEPAQFDRILAPFQNAEIQPDHIVLGCTHFPLVREQLSHSMPSVIWVDSGEAIARRVHTLLEANSLSSSTSLPEYTAVLTADDKNRDNFLHAIAPRGFHNIKTLSFTS